MFIFLMCVVILNGDTRGRKNIKKKRVHHQNWKIYINIMKKKIFDDNNNNEDIYEEKNHMGKLNVD